MAETPDTNPGTPHLVVDAKKRADQQLVMFLERDQLAAGTSVPLPRAPLERRVRTALWVLRVFVILLSIMVIYTFASRL